MTEAAKPWDGAIVRTWLERRVSAARSDQVAAERAGWSQRDDCDKAAAEEMICTGLLAKGTTDNRTALAVELKGLLDRDAFVWRGVYDDTRFERHVRSYIRKLAKMTKANSGFEDTRRYQ